MWSWSESRHPGLRKLQGHPLPQVPSPLRTLRPRCRGLSERLWVGCQGTRAWMTGQWGPEKLDVLHRACRPLCGELEAWQAVAVVRTSEGGASFGVFR
jgi:hypothetical protein